MKEYKFYCLVRKDLNPEQKAVQGGHALAQYFLNYGIPTNWDNGTLIYLGVKNESQLINWQNLLREDGLKTSHFIEPDLNNEITAIGLIAKHNHPLLKIS